MNFIGKISKFRCGLLLAFSLLAIVAAPVHAADPNPAYNVTEVTLSESGATGQFYRVTADLNVSWKPPTVAAPSLPPMYYYLKFNTSDAKLLDTEFNDTVYDFRVAGSLDHTVPAIPKATFDAYDYPQVHYLHIKTQFPTDTGFAFSEDVVVPLLIDNVAPGGTMTLIPASGDTREVNVTLSPLETIRYYWLSESSTYSPTLAGRMDVLSPSDLSPVWNLQSTALPPVQVPIYAWFQDLAGNRSATYAATATYSYTPTVKIVYISSSVELGGNLGFTVDGANYNWTITSRSPDDVATFSGGGTGPLTAASVTVVGGKVGTFTVTATPTGVGTPLVTGTINVVLTTISKTFNLITTTTTSTNTIGFIFENTGITTAHQLGTAVGSCTQVSKWNAATQSYLSHRMQYAGINDFTLNVGEAYFVTVTSEHPFTLTGQAPASHIQTLIMTTTTSTNAIGVPNSKSGITKAHALGLSIGSCSQVSKWNAATQSYLSHRMQYPAINDFDVAWGEGYFATVTQVTDWTW